MDYPGSIPIVFLSISPKVLQQESSVQKEVYTAIEQSPEIFHDQLSLNGDWAYKQTGQELAPVKTQTYYYLPETDISGWHTMQLPKNWFLAGLNYHGVIWFRREFRINSTWQGKSVWLRFAGVDYSTEVWLNGTYLGKHSGYFEPFFFDVTSIVKYDQSNFLAVRVDSPYEEYNTVWPGKKTLIKGIFAQDVARPGQTWGISGQEYNTGGIWNDIWLEANSFLTMQQAQLSATWQEDLPVTNVPLFKADISFLNVSTSPVEITLKASLAPENFNGETISFPDRVLQAKPGNTDYVFSEVIHDPVLWSTWDRGSPNLYRVQIRAYQQGNLLAEKSVLFGFREVKRDENWVWYLNGKRFFVRGTNYVSTQWLSQADMDWLQRDMGLMKDANLNFIRLPAHVEPQEFYELADELGLLVWQDFPLQWAYSEAPEFYDEAQRQMRAMVTELYNHPSIAVWCVHNESPWAMPELSKNLPNYDFRQNKQLDENLSALVKSLDPNRYVHSTSGTGDAHVSAGWASGSWMDFQNLPGQPFVSQFGAQALPDLPAMLRMFAPSQLVYHSGETGSRWEFQGFQSSPTFRIAKIDIGVPGEGYDQAISLIKNSQIYQANLIQYAIENYRRAKFNPMTGVIQYLFADPWQAITFSVLDYQRQPKLGYESSQNSYAAYLTFRPGAQTSRRFGWAILDLSCWGRNGCRFMGG